MSLMITGGSGFCGLNIAEQALSQGMDVVIYGVSAPADNVLKVLHQLPGKLAVVVADVCDQEKVIQTIKKHEVTYIIHAAAITAALEREKTDTLNILNVNINGTVNVLEAAIACNIKRLIYLSSGSVFGQESYPYDLSTYRLDELKDIPIPASVYGISKYAAERLSLRYRQTRGLDVIVVRLGVVFGRWEHDTGVRDTLSTPWNLMQLARANQAAYIHSSYPKDWVYATDVALALLNIITDTSCDVQQPLYHLSAGQTWSVEHWCAMLQEKFNSFKFELVDDAKQANVAVPAPTPRPSFATDHIRKDFGFAPKYLATDAFADYYAWFLAHG